MLKAPLRQWGREHGRGLAPAAAASERGDGDSAPASDTLRILARLPLLPAGAISAGSRPPFAGAPRRGSDRREVARAWRLRFAALYARWRVMVSHAPAAPTAAAGAGGAWLYGPSIDLLLGAGVGYLVSIPLLAIFSELSGVAEWPLPLFALLTLLISGPHYGATILRVYEHRRDRRRYAFFAVWATLVLCALFVLGLHNVLIGSLLVTLYVSWSPWHFSGQNYGLALTFLRRRGVVVEPRAKRLLYASFVLSFLQWFFVLHGGKYVVAVASVPGSGGSMVDFMSLRIPAAILEVAVPLTALVYVLSLVGAGVLLLRNARLRDLGPCLCLGVVQALWFALPALALWIADTPLNGLAFAIIWISAAHGLQYLWVSSYYARREDPSFRLGPYLGRTLLAGATVTILPGLIFAPGFLGKIPWDMGLAILLISVVNLHHFILDGAIWKLRDGRVARLLLRDSPPQQEARPTGPPRRSRFRFAMAVLGIASLGIVWIDVWQRELVVDAAGKGDVNRVIRASQWLGWIGRESPGLHVQVAQLLWQGNRPDAAVAEFRRSLEFHPTPAAWVGLGKVYASKGSWSEASEAFGARSPPSARAPDSAGEATKCATNPRRSPSRTLRRGSTSTTLDSTRADGA